MLIWFIHCILIVYFKQKQFFISRSNRMTIFFLVFMKSARFGRKTFLIQLQIRTPSLISRCQCFKCLLPYKLQAGQLLQNVRKSIYSASRGNCLSTAWFDQLFFLIEITPWPAYVKTSTDFFASFITRSSRQESAESRPLVVVNKWFFPCGFMFMSVLCVCVRLQGESILEFFFYNKN